MVVYHSVMSAFWKSLYRPVAMTATDWLVDIVILLGAVGFGMVQLTLSVNLFVPDEFTRMILGIKSVSPSIYAFVATFITCLPLIVRRMLPWPVFASTLILWVGLDWFLGIASLSMIGVLVALFTLSYERGGWEAFTAGAITLLAMFLSVPFGSSSGLAALLIFQNITLAVAVTLGGYAINARQKLVAEAEARATEAERTRESEASRRVEEERVRIAREVHDITAHSLSAVSIQAAAAERLIDIDPAAAKEYIAQVRATAKSSLEDIRAMVGVLRNESQAETTPVEGTDRMKDLVDYLENAGISCDLSMNKYNRSMVPSHIDVALYGIAREACTNIVRHANATRANIVLETSDSHASLIVEDNGVGMSKIAPTSGHGLEGMRERATLLGGTVDVSASAGEGLRIKVLIPVSS